MIQGLASEVQTKARELRTQQRNYLNQRKSMDSSSRVSFLEIAADRRLAEDYE